MRRPRALAAAVGLVCSVAVGGWGSSSGSCDQLRSGADRACAVAGRRLSRIAAPVQPSQGVAFLRTGIAGLKPELTALDRLTPSRPLTGALGRARDATRQELDALESTVKGLNAVDDPVVAIKTLQRQLSGPERRASAAWHALGASACADS